MDVWALTNLYSFEGMGKNSQKASLTLTRVAEFRNQGHPLYYGGISDIRRSPLCTWKRWNWWFSPLTTNPPYCGLPS